MNPRGECLQSHQLKALATGNISPAEAQAVRQHLRECSRCQSRWEQLNVDSLPPNPLRPQSAAQPADQDSVASSVAEGPPSLPDEEATSFPFLDPPVQPDEIGRLSDYRVLRFLSQGGMGIVFAAEDIALGRPVALKVIKPDLQGTDLWKRFLREARTLASIKHEHVVMIYRAGQERGVVFLAMELLEGRSLADLIKGRPKLPVREGLRLARETAGGLEAVHRAGLVHRDIKPANLWLEGPHGRVKILDFGLVRHLGDDSQLTQTGLIVGTPAYMSPEQARG